jgi:hypothetical protein
MGDVRKALERLWPAVEKAMRGLVFTADRAGEVAADMEAVRAALAAAPVPPAETADHWDAQPGERYCLACDKLGHLTNECWSTHGMNSPAARELFRLCSIANAAPPAEAQQPVAPPFTVESATVEGRLIGWRLSLGDSTVLVWRDQELMDGFRVGDGFVAPLGKTVVYAPTAPTGADAASEPADTLGALPSATACSVASLPEPQASRPSVPPAGARQFCTCDGAGRGPGRPCVVKAGGRLGDGWACREATEGDGTHPNQMGPWS